ncbi:hypothetical protein BDY19DRAFT_994804 [Irpex rosettiformis]|uniref:Uncharacterized protein n=1 Tax=Irpex rosettiformis TaxID=378272 RepID=A0ACB8TZF7_9APHY|nr:hypothetical protein BDY19DRAFT_994804 [Irpex rosettiformis]
MSSLPLNSPQFVTPSPEKFVGPCFVILCCTLILYGVFCAQTYYYFTTYQDNALLRGVVALLLLLEASHTGLCIHILYEYLISAWGNPIAAGKVYITVVIATYVEVNTKYEFLHQVVDRQANFNDPTPIAYYKRDCSSAFYSWYIYRIWRLRRQIIPTAFLVILLFVHIAISFRAAAYTNKYDTWVEVYGDKGFTVYVNCTIALNIALDASITAVLMFYLIRDRSRAAKRSTKRMMGSLIHFAFSTGILTVLTSCGLFVALNASKETLTFGGTIHFIAKLYANSMLAVLNARQSVKQAAIAETKFGVELSTMQPSTLPSSTRGPTTPIQIRTHTTVLSTNDDTWVDKREESGYVTSNIISEGVRVNVFKTAKEEV